MQKELAKILLHKLSQVQTSSLIGRSVTLKGGNETHLQFSCAGNVIVASSSVCNLVSVGLHLVTELVA